MEKRTIKIQRFFAIRGKGVLYVDKEKAESLPKSIWEGFKEKPCGEGEIGAFPLKIRNPVEQEGYFVDMASN